MTEVTAGTTERWKGTAEKMGIRTTADSSQGRCRCDVVPYSSFQTRTSATKKVEYKGTRRTNSDEDDTERRKRGASRYEDWRNSSARYAIEQRE